MLGVRAESRRRRAPWSALRFGRTGAVISIVRSAGCARQGSFFPSDAVPGRVTDTRPCGVCEMRVPAGKAP